MKYEVQYIISAFDNPLDYDKVEEYKNELILKEWYHDFPPILGFERLIDENDVGQFFYNGNEIEENHIGLKVWVVTDGHHRTKAFQNAQEETGLSCFDYIETGLDYNCITSM